jgi:hypothetical protein
MVNKCNGTLFRRENEQATVKYATMGMNFTNTVLRERKRASTEIDYTGQGFLPISLIV